MVVQVRGEDGHVLASVDDEPLDTLPSRLHDALGTPSAGVQYTVVRDGFVIGTLRKPLATHSIGAVLPGHELLPPPPAGWNWRVGGRSGVHPDFAHALAQLLKP